jgi:N-acetylglucosamine kinase-like BadF-type ATPase
VDESGAVAGRASAAGCNPNVIGTDAAGRIAAGALASIRASIPARVPEGRIAATLLCMAGPAGFWRDFAAGLSGFGRAVAVDDSLPVLELATDGGPGMVLHSGTGSFVAARAGACGAEFSSPDGVHYAGGLGWRFGDEGSGYDLGRRAIARGILELQGWEAPSGLGGLLREHTGLPDAAAVTRHFYAESSSNAEIASLAPRILALAEAGDPAALEAAISSALALLDLAVRVAGRVFPAGPPAAGLSGPILTHASVMPELLRRSPFPLRAVAGQPIEGVRRLLNRV